MNDTVDTIYESIRVILHEQHHRWREVISGMDDGALNWKPGHDTNSIAALVSHTFESERYHLAKLLDIEMRRDRETKFQVKATGADELLNLIDEGEREVDGYLDRMAAETLSTAVDLPDGTLPSARLILYVVQHGGEHVGQAEVTRQLWEQRGS